MAARICACILLLTLPSLSPSLSPSLPPSLSLSLFPSSFKALNSGQVLS